MVNLGAAFISTIFVLMFCASTNAGTCSSKGGNPQDKEGALLISKELISSLDPMRTLKAAWIASALLSPQKEQGLVLLNLIANIINAQMKLLKRSLPQMIEKSVNAVAAHMSLSELVYLKNNMTVAPMTEYYLSVAAFEEKIAATWEQLLVKDPSCDMSWPKLRAYSKKYLDMIAQLDFKPLEKLDQADIEKVKRFLSST